MLDILFIHPNFPGQYRQIAPGLAERGYRVTGLGSAANMHKPLEGVAQHAYKASPIRDMVTHFAPLEGLAASVRQGRDVADYCANLASQGYRPDVIIGHPGWGDLLFIDRIWPRAKKISYLEFFYRDNGPDVHFDPEFKANPSEREYLKLRNVNQLMAFEMSDICVAPTEWQKSLFSAPVRQSIEVVHEGVDTATVKPDPNVRVELPDGRILTRRDLVLTYCARNLEPYRGFHTFMRALPGIQRALPSLQTIIVGGNDVSYGRRPSGTANWKSEMLLEVGKQLDQSRLWFAGKLPFERYLNVLQLSTVHIYLTYPFVLSWSLVEAMAAGCTIVAADVGPVREALEDKVSAYLVPFPDVVKLQEGVVAAFGEHEETRLAIAVAAATTAAERFDFRRVSLPAYDRLIRTAISR